jgi:hypothetical protein
MVTGTDLPPLENPPIEHELGASSRINPETLLASAMPDWISLKTDSGADGKVTVALCYYGPNEPTGKAL